jgi:hypothetical protein
MMRTVLHESRLPSDFWAEAACSVAYVHNRLPLSGRADGKSPFELRFHRKPDLSRLRPFGTGCAVRLQKNKRRGKHVAEAERGFMVGYGYVCGQKGYRIFAPQRGKVITSADVTFLDLYQSV